jgi:hypothetical protein
MRNLTIALALLAGCSDTCEPCKGTGASAQECRKCAGHGYLVAKRILPDFNCDVCGSRAVADAVGLGADLKVYYEVEGCAACGGAGGGLVCVKCEGAGKLGATLRGKGKTPCGVCSGRGRKN